MQCKVCKRESCEIGWHVVASNSASNVDSPASNKGEKNERLADGGVKRGEGRGSDRQVKPGDLPKCGDVEPTAGTGNRKTLGVGEASDRKQRWSKDAYNAYQRDYMRKRRAAKSST